METQYYCRRWCRAPPYTENSAAAAAAAACPLQLFHGERELYDSDHKDTCMSSTILGKCTVHAMAAYTVRWLLEGQQAGAAARASLLLPGDVEGTSVQLATSRC